MRHLRDVIAANITGFTMKYIASKETRDGFFLALNLGTSAIHMLREDLKNEGEWNE